MANTVNKSYRWLYLALMLERMVFYGIKYVLVLYMIKTLGMNQEESLQHIGTFAPFVIGAMLLGGWLGDRLLSQRESLLVGVVFLLVGIFGLMGAWFELALSALSLGSGFIWPVAMGGILSAHHHHTSQGGRTRAMELSMIWMYLWINVGAFSATLLIGAFFEKFSSTLAFLTTGGLVLGIAIAGILASRDEQPAPVKRTLLTVLTLLPVWAGLYSLAYRWDADVNLNWFVALLAGLVLMYFVLPRPQQSQKPTASVLMFLCFALLSFFGILSMGSSLSSQLFSSIADLGVLLLSSLPIAGLIAVMVIAALLLLLDRRLMTPNLMGWLAIFYFAVICCVGLLVLQQWWFAGLMVSWVADGASLALWALVVVYVFRQAPLSQRLSWIALFAVISHLEEGARRWLDTAGPERSPLVAMPTVDQLYTSGFWLMLILAVAIGFGMRYQNRGSELEATTTD